MTVERLNGAISIWWTEAKDAAHSPTEHKSPDQNVNRAEVKKPWLIESHEYIRAVPPLPPPPPQHKN